MLLNGLSKKIRGHMENHAASLGDLDFSSVGDCVRTYRKAMHWTQKKLALEAEVTETYVADIEKNRAAPTKELLVKIANILHIEPPEKIFSPLFPDKQKKNGKKPTGTFFYAPKMPEDYLEKIENYIEDQVKVFNYEINRLVDSSGKIHPLTNKQAQTFKDLVDELDEIQDREAGEEAELENRIAPAKAENEDAKVKN